MPNVHHIAEAQPTEFDYHGEHIEIEYRKPTNDFAYSFVRIARMPFTGYGQTYERCAENAKKRVNRIHGEA